MSTSIFTETVTGEIFRFKRSKIAFSIDYRPDQQIAFVVSARDFDDVHHAKANADLAIALHELFEVVK